MTMHNIQKWFHAGETAYAQGDLDTSYQEFEKCTKTMPNLVEAWENLVMVLYAKTVSPTDIQNKLLHKAPKEIRARLQQKIDSLPVVPRLELQFLQLLADKQVDKAVENFAHIRKHNPKSIPDDLAILFLHHLFLTHEFLSKQQGRMRLEEMLNAWMGNPDIQYCVQVLTQTSNRLISLTNANPAYNATEADLLAFETLGLVHYTYGEYGNASIAFQWLLVKAPPQKQPEYRKHLAICYSLHGEYEKSLLLDPTNMVAWERCKPCDTKAFIAQSLKMHEMAKSIGKSLLPYWPAGMILEQSLDVTVAQLHDVLVCGQDPMIYDEHLVYVGNRGYYRHCAPQPVGTNIQEAIVVFATNANNHYHLLIEFFAKLLMASDFLPRNIPILLATNDSSKHQYLLSSLELPFSIRKFGVTESVAVEKLWVVDTTRPGHASTQPKNVWDCYLSSPESVRNLRNRLWKSLGQSPQKQDKFLYVRRNHGVRSLVDPQNLLETEMANWATAAGLTLHCFDGTEDFPTQVRLFGEAKVILGIHGAGLTNAIFAHTSAIVWEMPILHQSNTLFLELSAMVGVRHIFSAVDCDYLGTITVTPPILETLTQEWHSICSKL